jgi:hypothetical protein
MTSRESGSDMEQRRIRPSKAWRGSLPSRGAPLSCPIARKGDENIRMDVMTVRLIGWKPGLRTVSLIEAVLDCSTGSLAVAKEAVEDLLAGRQVTLTFRDEAVRDEFLRRAEACGAIAG